MQMPATCMTIASNMLLTFALKIWIFNFFSLFLMNLLTLKELIDLLNFLINLLNITFEV